MSMGIQKEVNRPPFLIRRFRLLSLCFLILIIIGLYSNSLGNLFTNWDDSMIYANPQIWSLRWESILNIFTPVKGVTYQPIRVLSYAVDYHFWELNPVGYHITSILFYIFTCITVFFFTTLPFDRLKK